MFEVKKIVITGPESTGKTTLAQYLSQYYRCPVVPEYAVEYLEKTDGRYGYRDLLKIAKGQIAKEEEIIKKSQDGLIICDTDLITIKIWAKVKYGKVPRWVMKTIRERKYDFYLLCAPDIEWEYDKFRENPHDRDRLFVLYEKELKKYHKPYVVISGKGEERQQKALEALVPLIKQ